MILYKRTCSVELQVKYTHEKKNVVALRMIRVLFEIDFG